MSESVSQSNGEFMDLLLVGWFVGWLTEDQYDGVGCL